MDVLYIHPAKQEVDARYDEYVASKTYPVLPVGVVGLANLLRQTGRQVRGLNLPLELTLRPTFRLGDWLTAQGEPSLALVDLHWYEHAFGALEVARAVKSLYPNTPVVLGGLTATAFAREILDRHPEVDCVVRGDAEEPLRRLADLCRGGPPAPAGLADVPNLTYRSGGVVRETPQSYVATAADLAGLDFVSLDFLEHRTSYAALQYTGAGQIDLVGAPLRGHWLSVGRGCLFECLFCGGTRTAHRRLAGRDGLVLRSPAQVAADIASLRRQSHQQVSLTLDPMMIGREFWAPLFAALLGQHVKVGLYLECFQLPSEEFLDAFVQAADLAHSEVALSPLVGDEAVRRRNGKLFSNARLLRTAAALAERQVPTFVYFSLNLPGETDESFRETLRLAAQVGRAYPPGLLRALNSCHTVDPLSPLSQQPAAHGTRLKYRSFADYYNYCRQTAWRSRTTLRGALRGFGPPGERPEDVEARAQRWDAFAATQSFRCFPVPPGW